MSGVRRAVAMLLALSAGAAAAALALRAFGGALGAELAVKIGWVMVFLSLGTLILAVRAAAAHYPSPTGAPEREIVGRRLLACSLVAYVIGVPTAVGLHLIGVLPWIGAVLYLAPVLVASAIGWSSLRAASASIR